MDGPAIKHVVDAATAAATMARPFIVEGPGYRKIVYPDDEVTSSGIARGWAFEDLPFAPVMSAGLVVHTLTGFADWIRANRDGLTLTDLVVHVVDEARVELLNREEGEEVPTRQTHLIAEFQELIEQSAGGVGVVFPRFAFGQWFDPQTFNIALQCLFVESEERARVLETVGDVRAQGVTTFEDDGITQGIIAAAGVKLGRLVAVPNPVTLAPFRTFREVDQPESKFVLRMRGEPERVPEIALFEADGGAWRLEAIDRIAAFLRGRVPAEVVVVA